MKTRLDSCFGAGKILESYIEDYVCPHCNRTIKVKQAPKGGKWMVSPHNPEPPRHKRGLFSRRKE